MGAAAIPIIIAAVGIAMQAASAKSASDEAKFQRKQEEQKANAIRAEAANQEAARRRAFHRAIQADLALNAASGVRNFLGGTPAALKKDQEANLERDILTIRANAAAGIRTTGLSAASASNRARGAQLQAFGTAAQIGLKAAQSARTQRTTG
jgi:hypothetical protein